MMTGRRVGSIDDIEHPGDYWYNPPGTVWFMLPNAASRDHWAEPRDLLNGLNRVEEPPWTITEHPDGSVSVQPSIAISGHDPAVDAPGAHHQFFHGYLHPGHQWEVLAA